MPGLVELERICEEKCPQECILTTYDSVSAVYERCDRELQGIRVTYMDLSNVEVCNKTVGPTELFLSPLEPELFFD